MPSLNTGISSRKQLKGKAYWRSLEELADTAEFSEAMKREFPEVATEAIGGQSRRSFLKYMGASLALAGLTMSGCRLPQEKIAPFAYRPPGVDPGIARQFATSMDIGGYGTGMLVTSFDGRPIKVEGNPLHPASLGAASAIGQASVLDVYDPDRSMHCFKAFGSSSREQADWDNFGNWAAEHFAKLKGTGGVGLSVLSEASSSPTFADMRQRFKTQFPQASWYEYEPASRDNERIGTELVFGRPVRPQYRLEQAEVIVALDADFLQSHPNSLIWAREFATGRRGTDNKMNRLFAVESRYSITGGMADERLGLPSSQVPALGAALASTLFGKHGIHAPEGLSSLADAAAGFTSAEGQVWLDKAAKALADHGTRSLVVAGENQPPEVHALAVLLNQSLGAEGHTVEYTDDFDPYRPAYSDEIGRLTSAMQGGSVNTLLIIGGNPVYNAPADLDFSAAIDKVDTTVHLSHAMDETSAACGWHLNRAHFMESWGDARSWDGTYSVVQPLIEPLYGGRSAIELLAMLSGDEIQSGHSLVQRMFSVLTGSDSGWSKVLHDGLLRDSAALASQHQATYNRLNSGLGKLSRSAKGPELTFHPDCRVHDGRFAGNGWLQEMPDPMTKMAWDNAILISVPDAEAQDIKHGDLLRVEVGGNSMELPAFVMPGQANGSYAVTLGYGRKYSSRIGNEVGFDCYPLRTAGAMDVATGVSISNTGKKYQIVATQDHHLIDEVGFNERERRVGDLIRSGSLAEYKSHPEFAKHKVHHPDLKSLWTEHQYTDYKWGMTIDLSSCTGCGACVVACQAENNIPVVGRKLVSEGREMHWIRIDRYFQGEPAEAKVANQPVTCHHCEMAPCEQVCPVAATVHTDEGLNDMVYNRCVGTRYCSNNCPYKVRRFNYFNYRKKMTETEKLVQNPEVTVRSRGVMEKCSFCVQRIQAAKITAKNEGRRVGPNEVVPACAQTCPSQAITFGDWNNNDSESYKLHSSDRSYQMLSELNIKPRISYLARLHNTGTDAVTGGHGAAPAESHGEQH